MKVIWAILSENAIVDRQSNNISLIEVIDELTVPVPPPQVVSQSGEQLQIPFSFCLSILFARTDIGVAEKGRYSVTIIGPDGVKSESRELDVDLMENLRSRSIGRMGEFPLPLTVEGQYSFKIDVKSVDSDWKEAFELPLRVNFQRDDPLA